MPSNELHEEQKYFICSTYRKGKDLCTTHSIKNVEIIETGLRPGEKLYEELLVRTDELDTSENDLIFVEKEKPISYDEVEQKLSVLKNAFIRLAEDMAVSRN